MSLTPLGGRGRVFSTFEVARICGVYHTTVINWANKGKLKAQLTPGGHRRIKGADLSDFMTRHAMPIPPGLALNTRRALIVEGEKEARGAWVRVLRSVAGLETSACAGGLEALLALGREAPDLLLLDLHLPQVNGLDVLKLLRLEKRTQEMRIIVVAAGPLTEEERILVKTHADELLLRPVGAAKLKAAAVRLLAFRATR